MRASYQKFVANCPACKKSYHYTETRFPGGDNDPGRWEVECDNPRCQHVFLIDIQNPAQSQRSFPVRNIFNDRADDPQHPFAEKAIHNVVSDFEPSFSYGGNSLYCCETNGTDLEIAAHNEFMKCNKDVDNGYTRSEPYLLKSSVAADFVVAHIPVPCECGTKHVASFYAPVRPGYGPPPIDKYLLADITGTNLSDRLEGIFSKTEVMDFLAKLLVRWHLTCDRIIVASPFVGHQWDKEEQKRDRWSWLLAQLDPKRATLITRPATLSAFKNLQSGDVTYELLKSYDLENKLISANSKKQDFHAKFFIGVGATTSEVLSGSANLVSGLSVENITFRAISTERCNERYISRMNVSLPAVQNRTPLFVCIFQVEGGGWTSTALESPFPTF